ncbi:MAG: fibronectin type III domain-containing protein, partial [Planctomycetota bacterium]|nr:fibronectin type III domain-containing protein [Planctomycetota bacterium]
GDLGIQFFLDGEGWRRVKIFYPDGRKMIDIKVKGNAGMIGLTEIFSESAEPSFDELPRDEFIALFPEGEYRMVGRSVEGARLVGVATLTHDMPDQPEITSPEEEEEVDAEDEFVIEWETVADPNWPDSIIEAYQIIVEKDEEEERLRVWTVDMLPTDTSVTLPAGFLEPGKAYKVEVIAVETSTNKTISEVEFETEDDD